MPQNSQQHILTQAHSVPYSQSVPIGKTVTSVMNLQQQGNTSGDSSQAGVPIVTGGAVIVRNNSQSPKKHVTSPKKAASVTSGTGGGVVIIGDGTEKPVIVGGVGSQSISGDSETQTVTELDTHHTNLSIQSPTNKNNNIQLQQQLSQHQLQQQIQQIPPMQGPQSYQQMHPSMTNVTSGPSHYDVMAHQQQVPPPMLEMSRGYSAPPLQYSQHHIPMQIQNSSNDIINNNNNNYAGVVGNQSPTRDRVNSRALQTGLAQKLRDLANDEMDPHRKEVCNQ